MSPRAVCLQLLPKPCRQAQKSKVARFSKKLCTLSAPNPGSIPRTQSVKDFPGVFMKNNFASSELTIAIPTWNRNEQINITVQKLYEQNNGKIKVLVLDNNSEIPVTKTIPEGFKQFVEVIRHPHNIGGCANLLRALEYIKSEWVWFLGDDDDPTLDALERIFSNIAQNKIVDYFDFGHPSGVTRTVNFVCKGLPNVIDQMYYPNGKPEIYSWSDGHISNEIFRTSILHAEIQTGYKFIYSMYPHVAMLFESIKKGCTCNFFGPVLCTLRNHNEAQKTYNQKDIALGWHFLSELITDNNTQKKYINALQSSWHYRLDHKVKPSYRNILFNKIKKFL